MTQRGFSYQDASRLLGLIVLFIVVAFFIIAIAHVVLLFAVVLVLAMVANPVVVALQRRHIFRGFATAIVIVAGIMVLSSIVALAGRPLLDQIQQLLKSLPGIVAGVERQIAALAAQHPLLHRALSQADQIVNILGAEFGGLAAFLLRSTYNIAGGLFACFFAFLLLIFILSNPRPLVAG